MTDDNKIAYYDSAIDLLPKTVQDVLHSDSVTSSFELLAEEARESNTALIDALQSLFIHDFTQMPLGVLIDNAPLAQQRAIDPKSVGRILTDRNTGLLRIGTMLELPVVGIRSDGSVTLLSGNHRVASLYAMLKLGGAEFEEIARQQILVHTVEVDREVLEERLSVDAKEPSEEDLLFALWISANQSRTVQMSEISDARQYKNNVKREPRAVGVAIREGTMTLAEARLFLASYFAINSMDESAQLPPRSVTPSTVPVKFVINNEELTLKRQTVEGVIKSFFSNLAKIKNEHNLGKYSVDIKDFDECCEILHRVFAQEDGNLSLFEYALTQVVNETQNSNIARERSKHGAKLAELYADSYDEHYPNRPKEKGSTRRAGKKSLAIM